MKILRRYIHYGEFWIDSSALPCPRCRSENLCTESHQQTGPITTCTCCGARSQLIRWNDGYVEMTREDGRSTYRHIGEHYQRPDHDVIELIK